MTPEATKPAEDPNAPFKGIGTIANHTAQQPEKWDVLQIVAPISLSITYKQPSPGEPLVYDYGREGNPTRRTMEEVLAALEGAKHCRSFGSGLATVSAITDLLKAGEHIVCSDDGYGGVQRFFREIAADRHGLSVDLVNLNDVAKLKASLKPNTKMVWFETPTNPLLKVTDIAEVVETVRNYKKDILIVVDNTFMTPYFQRPLELGVDVVMHSLTKYINGHADVLMGCAITNRDDVDEHLAYMQLCAGYCSSPFDCYLVLRGAKTLHVRMRQHQENGLAVAKWLEANPRVEKVNYPPLPSHPQHAIHKKQTTGMSGMMSFYIRGGLEEAKAFLANVKVFTLGDSLGATNSLAGLPVRQTHRCVPKEEREAIGIFDNLIRLSVGIEHIDDLLADLDQALKAAVPVIKDEKANGKAI